LIELDIMFGITTLFVKVLDEEKQFDKAILLLYIGELKP